MEDDFDLILSLLRSLLNTSATVQRWWKEVVARTNSAMVDTVCARYRWSRPSVHSPMQALLTPLPLTAELACFKRKIPPYKIVHFKLQRDTENAKKERMPAFPQNSNLTILQSKRLPPRAGDVFSTFPWWGMLPKYVNHQYRPIIVILCHQYYALSNELNVKWAFKTQVGPGHPRHQMLECLRAGLQVD